MKFKPFRLVLASTLAFGFVGTFYAGLAQAAQLPAQSMVMTRAEFTDWWQTHNAVGQGQSTNSSSEQLVSFNPKSDTINAQISQIAYVLGPGDTINIDVNNKAQFSRQGIILGSEDLISLPLVGEVKVQGKTVSQLAGELTEAYREFLVEPQVSIVVHKPRMQVSYILGAVDTPGPYKQIGYNSNESASAVPDFRLTTALANAGGMLSTADIEHVQVYNTQFGTHREVNLKELILRGEVQNDLMMKPNDVVYVPRLADLSQQSDAALQFLARSVVGKHEYPIRVMGLVRSPNVYGLKPDEMNLQAALAKSGGFLPNASAKKVVIARADETGRLHKLVIDSTAQQVDLRPDDIVMVTNTNGFTKLQRVFELAATLLKPFVASSFFFKNVDAVWDISTDTGN